MKEVQPEKGLAQGFSDNEAHQVNAITLMRIYDMLGAILNKIDPEVADAILKAHAEGRLIGPLPSLVLGVSDEP